MARYRENERLDSFEILDNGDVEIHSSDADGWATVVALTAKEVAGIAEASKVAAEFDKYNPVIAT